MAKKLRLRQIDEFRPLREVIIGTPDDMVFPAFTEAEAEAFWKGEGMQDFRDAAGKKASDIAPWLVDALNQDLDNIRAAYEDNGVIVHQMPQATPEIINYLGFHDNIGYCSWPPEDVFRVIGNHLIEMGLSDNQVVLRADTFKYRDLLQERFEDDNDLQWFTVPPAKPVNLDKEDGPGPFLLAADIFVLAPKVVLIGVSDSVPSAGSNRFGAEILKRYLGRDGYTVEIVRFDSSIAYHFDGVFGLVKPGVVAAWDKAFPDRTPQCLKDWEIIPITDDEVHGMSANTVPLNESSVLMPATSPRLAEEFEKRGVTVVPVDLTTTFKFCAGVQCCTLVLARDEA